MAWLWGRDKNEEVPTGQLSRSQEALRLKADLESEGDELQAKLEALRAADYREQLRAGVRGHGGEDIENMYDFARFVPEHGRATDVDSSVHLVRAREADLREQHSALEVQVEVQEEKLSAAARALQRYRGQVQQLVAQLGLRDLDAQRLSTQVVQLRRVLVEKERRLQEALDGAERAVLGSGAPGASPTSDRSLQQPQEAPTSGDEGQVLQLARIAEELTDALEMAREGEEAALAELEETAAKLEKEQALREQREHEFADARKARGAEVEELRRRIAEQEQALAAEQVRSKEFEQRAKRSEIEDFLQQRMASKGKADQFQPHLEI